MIFREIHLKGAFIIELEPAVDERGSFARTYCEEQFARHGLKSHFVQCNISYNRNKGTLRGLHYQVAPFAEAKLVICLTGSIHDVIVDLRPDSPTYCQWFAVGLNARHPRSMLYIPENFAHGFQTLDDNTEVFYQMSQFYHPEAARGFRWNDPAFNIYWPAAERILAEKDAHLPDFVR